MAAGFADTFQAKQKLHPLSQLTADRQDAA